MSESHSKQHRRRHHGQGGGHQHRSLSHRPKDIAEDEEDIAKPHHRNHKRLHKTVAERRHTKGASKHSGSELKRSKAHGSLQSMTNEDIHYDLNVPASVEEEEVPTQVTMQPEGPQIAVDDRGVASGTPTPSEKVSRWHRDIFLVSPTANNEAGSNSGRMAADPGDANGKQPQTGGSQQVHPRQCICNQCMAEYGTYKIYNQMLAKQQSGDQKEKSPDEKISVDPEIYLEDDEKRVKKYKENNSLDEIETQSSRAASIADKIKKVARNRLRASSVRLITQ